MSDKPGWIKLHRKIVDSRVFASEGLFKVWVWCILKANHAEEWLQMKTGKGNIEVQVQPGQFIFGRDSAARELSMPPSSVRNRMSKLKNMQNLDIKQDKQYSLITVVNWDTYQLINKKEDSKEAKQRTGKGQAKDTNNNNKNEKNKYIARFDIFYKAYPKHIGKQSALKVWLKNPELSKSLFDTLMKALENQKKTLFSDPKFIPYPATWLNGKRWEDEMQGAAQADRTAMITSDDLKKMREED